MYRIIKLFSVLLLIGLFYCCSVSEHPAGQWMIQNGKVKVLSTIAMIDDLVGQIGGEHIDHFTLIQGELDPHSYQLVKGDDEKLAFADLIFYNGLGLEHGPSLQNYLVSKTKAIPLGNQIMNEDKELILYHEAQVDPHIWMDVSLWMKTVPYIVEALSKMDPAHFDEYHRNASVLLEKMKQVDQEIRKELQSIPQSKRYLVTTHDAFSYFTRAYLAEEGEADWRIRCAAPEGLAPESQISTTDIQQIIDHLAKYNIHTLFPESNINKDSIRKVVQAGREKGLDIQIATVELYADAMGRPGSDGDTYLKMVRHNAHAVASRLDFSPE